MIAGGDGVYLESDQGRCNLEAMSASWCASLGAGNNRLADAGSDALHTLPNHHMFDGRSKATPLRLCEGEIMQDNFWGNP